MEYHETNAIPTSMEKLDADPILFLRFLKQRIQQLYNEQSWKRPSISYAISYIYNKESMVTSTLAIKNIFNNEWDADFRPNII